MKKMYKAPVVVAENLQATSILMSSPTPTPGGLPTSSDIINNTGGDAPIRGL